MLQLDPPLPMNTPKGEGFAQLVIDYGPESDLYWTVFITETGEIWTFANKEVRASKNITLGRTNPSLPKAVPAPTEKIAAGGHGARAGMTVIEGSAHPTPGRTGEGGIHSGGETS